MWGDAVIGPSTLTFYSGQEAVIWEKPTPLRPSLTGVYHCETAPGGCQTTRPIELRADGSWSWGRDGGKYAIVGGRVQFSGLTSGPAGWGPADIGAGTLTFRDERGASVWRQGTDVLPSPGPPGPQPPGPQPPGPAPAPVVRCDPNVPRYAQPGCQEEGEVPPPGPRPPGPAPAPVVRCNPNVPRYAQPGCKE